MHKIEKRQFTNRMAIYGIILSIILAYFSFFMENIFDLFFPVMVFLLLPLTAMIFTFILFQNYFKNRLKISIVKTVVLFFTLNFFQLSSIPLMFLINFFFTYEQYSLYLAFIAQGWTAIIIFFFYNKFSKYIYKGIRFINKHFSLVLLGVFYLIALSILFKYSMRFYAYSFNTMLIIVILSIFTVSFFTYIVYKYYLKRKIESNEKS